MKRSLSTTRTFCFNVRKDSNTEDTTWESASGPSSPHSHSTLCLPEDYTYMASSPFSTIHCTSLLYSISILISRLIVQISLICVSFFVVHVQSRSVIQGGFTLPVCFIQNDDFMSSLWQGNFLLSEHFNFIPHNINTSVKKIMINSIS